MPNSFYLNSTFHFSFHLLEAFKNSALNSNMTFQHTGFLRHTELECAHIQLINKPTSVFICRRVMEKHTTTTPHSYTCKIKQSQCTRTVCSCLFFSYVINTNEVERKRMKCKTQLTNKQQTLRKTNCAHKMVQTNNNNKFAYLSASSNHAPVAVAAEFNLFCLTWWFAVDT